MEVGHVLPNTRVVRAAVFCVGATRYAGVREVTTTPGTANWILVKLGELLYDAVKFPRSGSQCYSDPPRDCIEDITYVSPRVWSWPSRATAGACVTPRGWREGRWTTWTEEVNAGG